MNEPNSTTPRRAGRVKWVLILSLAVNVFVLTIVIGAAVGHHWDDRHRPPSDVGFGPFTEMLSREDRAALRDAFLAAAPDFRDRRQEAKEDFSKLVAALRADPWDQAAVDAAIEAQGARTTRRLELGRRLLVERIAAMSPDARQALAERIESVMSRHWRR